MYLILFILVDLFYSSYWNQIIENLEKTQSDGVNWGFPYFSSVTRTKTPCGNSSNFCQKHANQ